MTISRAVLAVALLAATAPAAAGDWKVAVPDYGWSFPRDHWAHDGYRTEWWYFTGELEAEDDPGRRFGYQFTIFRVGVLPDAPDLDSGWSAANVVMGHAAIGDLAREEHRFSDVLRRATPLLGGFAAFPDRPVAWVLAPAGTDGRWSVDWNGDGFDIRMRDDARGMAFELTTRPVKPRVFQGPNGFSRKGEGASAASQYYSFPRLSTSGTLALDGTTWRVTGTSWMDKEFGSSQLSEEQVGWDWFSLRLDDGRDLMLYLLRRADGTADYRNGTLVGPDGRERWLDDGAWSVRATATWTSAATESTYPARWRVEVPSAGIEVEVVPEFADQENRGGSVPDLHYWEGAVRLLDDEGEEVGRGYVELTGYGEDSRPPI